MTILLAPDKFKGSLSAAQVCDAMQVGLSHLNSSLSILSVPIADGGEGTAELLTTHTKGVMVHCGVHDPLFRKINATYGLSGDGTTAFIEMASASGLQLLSTAERNPLKTSTFGTGELVANAIARGVQKIVLAIGGSATNDAGIGMAAALGIKFLDQNNQPLKPIGENLIQIHTVDDQQFTLKLKPIEVIVLCDVNNELYGTNGAAHVYAPQKGADHTAVLQLDAGLRNFAAAAKEKFNCDVHFPGAGAAGGLGAGAKTFLNASFSKGIDYILNALELEHKIMTADLVFTGEGKMDDQTLSGKVVMGVAQLAAKHAIPVVALVGKNELPAERMNHLKLSAVITLTNANTTEQESMEHTHDLIVRRILENEYLKSIIN